MGLRVLGFLGLGVLGVWGVWGLSSLEFTAVGRWCGALDLATRVAAVPSVYHTL